MTDIIEPETQKFFLNRPAPPMLSRVAASMYWMSRYVERAEHVARLMLVNTNVLTDVGDIGERLEQRLWYGVLKVMNLEHTEAAAELLSSSGHPAVQRVAAYMTFDPENPNSLINCLTRARENARSIRENISAEMWENLNTLYWTIRADDARQRFEDSPQEIYRQMMTGSLLFQGLTDHTMAHSQGWLFTQLAKYLERIDITCRVLDTKFEILGSPEGAMQTPLRNIHWMAVLRSCCSIEAYRRMHPGDMDPLRVTSFLILERNFPRSICYSVRHTHSSIAGIRAATRPNTVDPAERILVRLYAQLENGDAGEIMESGVQPYLRDVQAKSSLAALAVQKAYFLHA